MTMSLVIQLKEYIPLYLFTSSRKYSINLWKFYKLIEPWPRRSVAQKNEIMKGMYTKSNWRKDKKKFNTWKQQPDGLVYGIFKLKDE